MKLLRTTACLAALVSVGMVSGHLNAHLITDPDEVGADEYDGMGPHMRLRFLADGSGVITPPPPTPTTAAPRTTAPPPPPPTTVAPVTNKPTTAPPATEAPATTAPATRAPTTAPATRAPTTAPTTAPPNTNAGSGSSASSKKTTPPPATQKPRVDNNKDTGSSANTNPSNEVTDTPAPSVEADTVKVSTEKKMSTGVVAGIVAGIVGGVAVLGLIIVSIIRRRRDDDDDPLSPFELSTDKSHTAPALLGSNVGGYGGSYNQKNTNTVYTNHTSQYNGNNNAYAAGAAAAGGAGVVATRARKNDTISSNSSSAAGRRPQAATSQQFYDSVTSPNGVNVRPQPNLYHSKLSSNDSDVDVHTKDSSNLWLSAMEAQTAANTELANDVEGYPRDTEGAFSPRNSYDDVPSYDIDIDQSSVISGGSDLDKEIPDLVESSSRGSYEL